MLISILFWIFAISTAWLFFAIIFNILEWILQTGEDYNPFPKELSVIFIIFLFITIMIKLQI